MTDQKPDAKPSPDLDEELDHLQERVPDSVSKVMKKVHENALWVPIVHEGVVMVANKKLKNLKAHNIYASMLYKALDVGP